MVPFFAHNRKRRSARQFELRPASRVFSCGTRWRAPAGVSGGKNSPLSSDFSSVRSTVGKTNRRSSYSDLPFGWSDSSGTPVNHQLSRLLGMRKMRLIGWTVIVISSVCVAILLMNRGNDGGPSAGTPRHRAAGSGDTSHFTDSASPQETLPSLTATIGGIATGCQTARQQKSPKPTPPGNDPLPCVKRVTGQLQNARNRADGVPEKRQRQGSQTK